MGKTKTARPGGSVSLGKQSVGRAKKFKVRAGNDTKQVVKFRKLRLKRNKGKSWKLQRVKKTTKVKPGEKRFICNLLFKPRRNGSQNAFLSLRIGKKTSRIKLKGKGTGGSDDNGGGSVDLSTSLATYQATSPEAFFDYAFFPPAENNKQHSISRLVIRDPQNGEVQRIAGYAVTNGETTDSVAYYLREDGFLQAVSFDDGVGIFFVDIDEALMNATAVYTRDGDIFASVDQVPVVKTSANRSTAPRHSIQSTMTFDAGLADTVYDLTKTDTDNFEPVVTTVIDKGLEVVTTDPSKSVFLSNKASAVSLASKIVRDAGSNPVVDLGASIIISSVEIGAGVAQAMAGAATIVTPAGVPNVARGLHKVQSGSTGMADAFLDYQQIEQNRQNDATGDAVLSSIIQEDIFRMGDLFSASLLLDQKEFTYNFKIIDLLNGTPNVDADFTLVYDIPHETLNKRSDIAYGNILHIAQKSFAKSTLHYTPESKKRDLNLLLDAIRYYREEAEGDVLRCENSIDSNLRELDSVESLSQNLGAVLSPTFEEIKPLILGETVISFGGGFVGGGANPALEVVANGLQYTSSQLKSLEDKIESSLRQN